MKYIMKNDYKKQQYPFERFASVRRYIGFDFLKDSKWIVYIADTNGQFNLWRQRSYLSSENEPYASYQLTNFTDNAVKSVFSSPLDNSIIFFADYQGTENFQIYMLDNIFYSWPRKLTNNPKVRYEWGPQCFSHDGKFIMYGSNEDNSSNMLIYIRNMMNSEDVFCITKREGWYIPGYWSQDNKKLNYSQLVTFTNNNIWLFDVEDRIMEYIDLGNKDKSRFYPGPWDTNRNGFYVISDLGREFANVAFYDVDNLKLEWILTPEHDIELVDISPDGKILTWTENIDGYNTLFTKNLQNEEVRQITAVSSKGVIRDLKLSPDGKRIGVILDTPTSAIDIYIIDIQNDKENRCEKITDSILGNISIDILVKPELIRYKSFDGLDISAFLYKPQINFDSTELVENNQSPAILFHMNDENKKKTNKRFGAILSIHGGPNDQERPSYTYCGLYQYLANNGLVIIAPNFRGSKGYGKTFEKKIYHDWGGNELKDLEYSIKWLLSQDWIDPHRIGVFGGSFGGFASLNCITRLTHYNWKAAVDIVGPSNLITFTKSVPEHWKRFMEELVGDPQKEENFLKERSPITYIDSINPITKLLVIQGANDPRVVKEESDQIVERLNDKGIRVEYEIFYDEGHGFDKYSNLLKALKICADFLVIGLS